MNMPSIDSSVMLRVMAPGDRRWAHRGKSSLTMAGDFLWTL